MPSYYSLDAALAELGDEEEWRRLWKSLMGFTVRVTAKNFVRVAGRSLTQSELKGLIRGQARSLFGVSSRVAYFRHMRVVRAEIKAAPSSVFAGQQVIRWAE